MSSQDDKKQNRLSTLSQDVIAVPKKGAAPVQQRPEPKTETRAVPPTQDVFRVPSPVSAPARKGSRDRPAEPVVASQGIPMPVMVVGALSVLALLAAVAAFVTAGGLRSVVDMRAQETARLQAELGKADERIAKLEAKLSGADEEARKMEGNSQGNLLQLTASLRGIRGDVENLADQVNKLSAQVNAVGPAAGAAQKDAKTALAQVEQFSARLGQVSDQAAAVAKGAKGADANADIQSQLKAVNQKTDKLAGDIRQLYRVLEGQGN